LVLEAVVCAILLVISLLIFYQISPSTPVVSSETELSDLKTKGDDSLRFLNGLKVHGAEEGYPDDALSYYLAKNNFKPLKENLSLFLPDTIEYNVYISNGKEEVFWFSSGSGKLGPMGPTARSYRYVSVDIDLIKSSWHGEIIPGYQGSTYQVVLELWYI